MFKSQAKSRKTVVFSLMAALALVAAFAFVPTSSWAQPFIPLPKCGEIILPADGSPAPLAITAQFFIPIEVIPCPEPSKLIPQLRVSPDRVVSTSPETLVSYSFKVKNTGKGTASNVRVEIPIPAGLVSGYLDTASDAGVWVKELSDSKVTIGLPKLNAGDVVSGKMVFRPSGATAGAGVTASYNLFFDDDSLASQQVRSNLQYFSYGDTSADASQGAVQPGGSGTAKIGQPVQVVQQVYLASELVTLWYTGPDGKTVALGSVWSDTNGMVTVTLSTAAATPGVYTIVGYGNLSEVTEVSTLTLVPAE